MEPVRAGALSLLNNGELYLRQAAYCRYNANEYVGPAALVRRLSTALSRFDQLAAALLQEELNLQCCQCQQGTVYQAAFSQRVQVVAVGVELRWTMLWTPQRRRWPHSIDDYSWSNSV